MTNRVRELRKSKGLSQAKFAEVLSRGNGTFSITADAISKIERGNTALATAPALRMCETYNVSLDWLSGRTDTEQDKASIILAYLHDVFRLAPSMLTYTFEGGDCVEYPYYKLTIDALLDKFLRSITTAENFKREKDLPEEGYQGWIEGAKREYNEALQKGAPNETVEWVLVPREHLDEDIIGVLMERILAQAKMDQA